MERQLRKRFRERFEEYVEGIVWRYLNVVRPAFQRETVSLTPTVKVMLDDGAYMPVRAHMTDAGADLKCMEDFTVQPRDSMLVDTGVHVELPHGTVGMLKSKSCLDCMGAVTTTGVIDEGYTGSIKVRVYNHGEYPREFKAGDKITQLVVMPVTYPTIEQVEEIEGGERGDAGYGSTGR